MRKQIFKMNCGLYMALLALCLAMSGCHMKEDASGSGEADKASTAEKEVFEKEKADMTTEEMVSSILECDAETSRELIGTMEEAGIPGVESVELWRKKANTILMVTGSDERQYYVKVGRGYFISEIRQDAADGKRIYRAIQ